VSNPPASGYPTFEPLPPLTVSPAAPTEAPSEASHSPFCIGKAVLKLAWLGVCLILMVLATTAFLKVATSMHVAVRSSYHS
jgi:hypothetical protein